MDPRRDIEGIDGRSIGHRQVLCYRGGTSMAAPKKATRAGRTAKVSISLDRADLAVLRRRARHLHGGNVSAVVAEGIRRIQEEEGREALVAWLGATGDASPSERERIVAEWAGEKPAARRRSAARK
jgi:hypothetical protein